MSHKRDSTIQYNKDFGKGGRGSTDLCPKSWSFFMIFMTPLASTANILKSLHTSSVYDLRFFAC